MIKLLYEAKDLNLFKKLLKVFSEYTDAFPATGVDRLLNKVMEKGIKVIPKDKNAQEILSFILYSDKSAPAKVQELLNCRFADLPVEVKPIYKVGNRKEVAFWSVDDKIYDKVVSLLDFDGEGKTAFWAGVDRKKVELLSLQEDKE